MATICFRKCCCCNIKVGSILISLLYLIIFTLLTSVIIWFIINVPTWDSVPADRKATIAERYTTRFGINIDNPDDLIHMLNASLNEEDWMNDVIYEYNMDMFAIPVAFLIVSIVNLVTSICLITGVVTNKSSLFIPHLITNIIFMVIFVFMMNYGPMSLMYVNGPAYIRLCKAFVASLIFQFIPCGLFIYMWIVVYSHYCVLKEENARGQYDKQVYRSA